MQETAKHQDSEIFLEINNGEYLQFDMNLSMQILFDDVMTFISKNSFDD